MKRKKQIKSKSKPDVSREAKLSARQLRFIDEYVIDLSATKAAIRAGYSAKTAGAIGCENLTKPKIKVLVDEKLKEQGDKSEQLRDRVMQEMGRLAFVDIRKAFDKEGKPKPIQELDDDTAAAIAGIEVEVETSRTRKINEDGEDEGDQIQTEIARTHKFKMVDKQGALVSLARHLGMFDKDKVKVIGDKDHPVVHKIDAGAELADVMTLEQLEEVKRRVIAKSNAG